MGNCANQNHVSSCNPEGEALDPMEKQGDIVGNIMQDQHIAFYQKKLTQVLRPLGGQKKIRNTKEIQLATSDKQQHKKYIQSVNEAIKNNSVTATNVLSFMVNEIADAREKGQVQAKIDAADQFAALKCFVYLYTGNYTYKRVNTMLRKSQYQKMAKVIALIKNQLALYNEGKFARRLTANSKNGRLLDLYRGIMKPDKMMTSGKTMYWRAFTSTSLDRKVASNFGRYQYIIELDNSAPHDYIVVPKDLSQYDEEQIIIFPYLHFTCMQVQDFTNGATYKIKQVKPSQN